MATTEIAQLLGEIDRNLSPDDKRDILFVCSSPDVSRTTLQGIYTIDLKRKIGENKAITLLHHVLASILSPDNDQVKLLKAFCTDSSLEGWWWKDPKMSAVGLRVCMIMLNRALTEKEFSDLTETVISKGKLDGGSEYKNKDLRFFKELMNRKFIEPPANVVPLICILEELHLDSAADVLKDYMREVHGGTPQQSVPTSLLSGPMSVPVGSSASFQSSAQPVVLRGYKSMPNPSQSCMSTLYIQPTAPPVGEEAALSHINSRPPLQAQRSEPVQRTPQLGQVRQTQSCDHPHYQRQSFHSSHDSANQSGQTSHYPQEFERARCYSESRGTSTDVYGIENRERSLTFPTDNGPRQGGAPQHMSLQSTQSVSHPTAEMHHSSDPLSAPTTHISRFSSSESFPEESSSQPPISPMETQPVSQPSHIHNSGQYMNAAQLPSSFHQQQPYHFQQQPTQFPYQQQQQQSPQLLYQQQQQQPQSQLPYQQQQQQPASWVPYQQQQQQPSQLLHQQQQQQQPPSQLPYQQQQPASWMPYQQQQQQQPSQLPYQQQQYQTPSQLPYQQQQHQTPSQLPYQQQQHQTPSQLPYQQQQQPLSQLPYQQQQQQQQPPPSQLPYQQQQQQQPPPSQLPYQQQQLPQPQSQLLHHQQQSSQHSSSTLSSSGYTASLHSSVGYQSDHAEAVVGNLTGHPVAAPQQAEGTGDDNARVVYPRNSFPVTPTN